MCEDYPCCGHTAQDPCGYSGPTMEDYLTAGMLGDDFGDYWADDEEDY